MPHMDYSKMVIYVLRCNDDSIKEEYLGSTTNFNSRKYQHKKNCNNNENNNLKIYKIIRDHGGWANWNMIQLEAFSCKNKREVECRIDNIRVDRKFKFDIMTALIKNIKKNGLKKSIF